MRLVLALLVLLASPAAAWEASSNGPVCLLSHEVEKGTVLVSHDPRKAVPYAIQIRRSGEAWAGSPQFSIFFDGPGRLTIATDRHQLVDDNAEVVVTDTGFDNVLFGLESNFIAMAQLGKQSIIFPLTGAAPEVAKFRACSVGAGV